MKGVATTGYVISFELSGGNTTNSIGHGGKHPIWSLLMRRAPEVKADGTYTTNSGLIGVLSYDEAGRQAVHHDHPDHIAYTTETGLQGAKEAPFGSVFAWLAKHNVGMKPGKEFDGIPLAERPDMPSPALLALQACRRLTYARKHTPALLGQN